MISVTGVMDERQVGGFDLAIFQRQYMPKVYETAQRIKTKNRPGKARTKLVYEIDDDLFSIPDWNPAKKELGNPQVQDYVKRFCNLVDAVFVTTEDLAEVYRQYNDNVFVLPNSVPFELFTPKPDNSVKPVVLWQGSHTHKKDLALIEPAMQQLKKDGDCFPKVFYAPMKGIYQVPPVEFKGFHVVLSQTDATVGLAPLVPCKFNLSKSNLKFLEYTAQGIVTIASDFGPYQQTITHGVDGYLAKQRKDWYELVRYVLNNEQERKEVLKNATKLVEEKYDLNKNYALWQKAIDTVLEEK